MTQTKKTQAGALLTLFLAGIALVIASVGAIYSIQKVENALDCNKAYAYAQNRAQNERIPFWDKQNDALIEMSRSLSGMTVSPDDVAVARLIVDAEKLVMAAEEYKEQRNLYEYPTSSCPKVKGVTS